MNGFRVFADESVLDLGDILVGETRTGKFKINNARSKPVVILGAWTDCSCLVTDELPMTIPSRSKVDFDVKLQTDSSMTGRHIVREVILNLDVDQPAIALKIKFSVTGTNGTAGVQ